MLLFSDSLVDMLLPALDRCHNLGTTTVGDGLWLGDFYQLTTRLFVYLNTNIDVVLNPENMNSGS